MNPAALPRRAIGIFCCAALLSTCLPAAASELGDKLKRCLAQLDGIAWQLPYQPPMHIRSCATATDTHDTATTMPAGAALLELTGELTLGPRPSTQDSDHDYASVHSAAFTHFDALFRRYGYVRGEVGYGDARTRYPLPHALAMKETPEEEARRLAPLTPIPYVNLARFTRAARTGTIRLTYKQEMRNSWSIRIDGMPPPGSPR